MKKIGIIGGLSAESTIEYYKILVREYNIIKGGASSPLLIIDSLDLESVRNLMVDNSWEKVYQIILKSAKNLEGAGAEIIIIATNTIHKIFEKLAVEINTPMISIMDATAEAIKEKGIQKVGLIGTIFTMQADFYQNSLNKYGIDVIVPNKEDQEYVNTVIWGELTHHILTPESREGYLDVIKRLKSKGAEGVILGCTEIPLLITQDDSTIPVFDTAKLHALAALKMAIK
jgi:aspartate racemase